MDEDGKNLTPEVEGADESSLDDDLLAQYDELGDSLTDDGGDEFDGGAGDDDEGNPAEGETGDTDDDGEGGQTYTDDASADDDTAKASAGKPAKEPVAPEPPSKEDRINARKLAAVEKYAKDMGYASVEAMIADQEGEDADTVKARLESDELTTEEKAALWDKQHSMTEDEKREEAGKQFFNKLLAEIHEAYPETAETVKKPSDIEDEETFRLLVLKGGKSAVDAFKMTNAGKIKHNAPLPNGKGHLHPDARNTRGASSSSLSASELRFYRSVLGEDVSPKQIEDYIKRVQ